MTDTSGEAGFSPPENERSSGLKPASPLRFVIGLALTAAAVRLIFLQWLHPLNWDEIEFWRATSWIAEGRLPFRDFWEHHTPLLWFLFAPFTLLTDSEGVHAILALRWAQILIWIATFSLVNTFMRGADLDRFSRWAAMGVALCSSLLMIPAVEYRIDSLGCMLLMAVLVLAQRERYFWTGVVMCLAGFANVRLGPLLLAAIVLFLVTRRQRAAPIIPGGAVAFAICIAFFAATGSLDELWQQVWIDNLAEKYATPVQAGFIHRLLVPFGVRIMASDRLFELAAVDVGGITVLLVGAVGMFLAFRQWLDRRDLFELAVLQLVSLLFTAYMKFIFNYHFAVIVVLMIPLIALVIEQIPRKTIVVAVLCVAWSVNAFASIFRGKEWDRAYQDRIMREVHARTKPGDTVFSGIPWGLRREPAYAFWFLPELPRQLVSRGLAKKYKLREAPAAFVFDYNMLHWVGVVQRNLAPYFVRHYIPVWRELWIPGMNARIAPRRGFRWSVPRDGDYRVYVSPELARHPWFRDPIATVLYKRPDASRLTVTLPATSPALPLLWTIDRRPVQVGSVVRLRRGQKISVTSRAAVPVAVLLISSDDRTLFRQPPPRATLEGEATRITHVPQIGATIAP